MIFSAAAGFVLAACQTPIGHETASKPASAPAPAETVDKEAAAKTVFAASLIGLPRERVQEVFGKPRWVRREAPAEVWQYAGKNCVLDLYLYQVEGGGMSVSFVEARDGAAIATEPESCFSTLVQRASL